VTWASLPTRHYGKPTVPLHDKPVTDQQTTVLYVLTTLAQSCAALAAFVGAVGVFRIQMLREQRQGAERDLRELGQVASLIPAVEIWKPINEIAQDIDAARKTETHANNHASIRAFKALDAWRAFAKPLKRARTALLFLEGWNLAVIALALIGFNHIPVLALSSCFSYILVGVVIVTALVPLGCVWVWTQGVDQ
jgi:hypothetical protein